jgi:cytochrome c oxidase cbb3-type subunit 4
VTLETSIEVLRSLWGLWVMIFFGGIVLWAYWPKSKGKIESQDHAPPRDDDDKER